MFTLIRNIFVSFFIAVILFLALEVLCYYTFKTKILGDDISIITGTILDDKAEIPEVYQGKEWFSEYIIDAAKVFHDAKWSTYTYWQSKPIKSKYINIDDDSVRLSWKPGKSEFDYDIYIFGGSTVWGWGARDFYTIPSYLSKILYKKYGINAKVINLGELGYVTSQEVITLFKKLTHNKIRFKPKKSILVFYDGLNDIYGAFQAGKAGVPQNEFIMENIFHTNIYEKFIKHLFDCSSLYKIMQYYTLKNKVKERYNTKQINLLATQILENYKNNMQIVKIIAEKMEVKLLTYWQPVIFTKKNLTKSEKKLEHIHSYSKNLFLEVNRQINSHMRGFKDFYNISDILDYKYSIYIDPWHIDEAGNKIIATKIAQDIVILINNKSNSKD